MTWSLYFACLGLPQESQGVANALDKLGILRKIDAVASSATQLEVAAMGRTRSDCL